MPGTITTRLFFDGDSMHGPTSITIEGSTVAAIEPLRGEADHHLVCPGLVDLQMNGFGSVDCSRANASELAALDARLASLGTTSWLATIVTAPLDRLDESIGSITEAIESGHVPGCRGIHVEGPFLGSAHGAHRSDWVREPDPTWVDALPDTVRLVTVGAESNASVDLVRALVDRGITVSLGHTRPSDAQYTAVVAAGASMVTHLFNGMSGVHHRDDGLALSALLDDRVATGLIADMVHVSPAAVSLAFRAKRGRGVVLVSDSVAWESPWARSRGVSIRSGAPRLWDGTLAGSSTPLLDGLVRSVTEASVDVAAALRAATSTPADVIGDATIGRIRMGLPCDILTFDDFPSVRVTGRRLVFPRGIESHP